MTGLKNIRLVSLILIMLATGIALPLIYRYLTEGNIFSLEKISILQSSDRRQKEIQVYLKNYIGKPLYGISLEAIRERVQEHPWILSAAVRRLPPHELQIDIRERKPLALIALDRLYVVDESGELFKLATDDDGLHLPLITGISRDNLKPITHMIRAIINHQEARKPGGDISELRLSKHEQIWVYFSNGLEVVLGNSNFQTKWKKLIRLENELSGKKNNLAFAYLDDYPNSNQVAVRFKKTQI